MKFDIQEINKYAVAADTDSSFLMLTPLLKKRFPDLDLSNDDAVLEKIKPIQDEVGKIVNDFQTPASKELFNCTDHFFDMKPEFIVKKAYWSGKRRYAQYLVDREGNRIEKFVMMGLDIMKSNFSPYFRKFGEQLIKDILLGKSKEEIDNDVRRFKESITELNWMDLSKPSGLKKLKEYIAHPPREGEVFSTLEKKCPINTKAAIYSNDIIRYYKLQKEYPEFTLGDKIKTVALKDNPYKIDVIGLNGYKDAPIIMDIATKYIDKDGLFDSIIRNKLETIYNDVKWVLNLNPYVNVFESFEID